MLVEGRITQPPSTRSVDSGRAGVRSARPVPHCPPSPPPPPPSPPPSPPLSPPPPTQSEAIECGQVPSVRPSAHFRSRTSGHHSQQSVAAGVVCRSVRNRSNHHRCICAPHNPTSLITRVHRNLVPLNRVRHWFSDFICNIIILVAYLCCASTAPVSSFTSSSTTTNTSPVRTLFTSHSVRSTSTFLHHRINSSSSSAKSVHRHSCQLSQSCALILISLVVMTSLASESVHCWNSQSLNPIDGSSSTQHSTTAPSHRHTPSPTPSPNPNPNPQLRQVFERQFLNMMGLSGQPRPPPSHKVPQFMLELYHWFRSSNRQRKWLQDEADSDSDSDLEWAELSAYRRDSHAKRPTAPNGVISLTSEDLWHVNPLDWSELDEDEAQVIRQIDGHHRAPSQRRASQQSRATLTGPANTVISHKLVDHDNVKVNRRRKRSTSTATTSDSTSEEDVLLKFSSHLPDGEFLKGAELRLYRHSIFDLGHNDNHKQQDSSSRSRPLWPLYHWSVRYRADTPVLTPVSFEPQTSSNNNSHNNSNVIRTTTTTNTLKQHPTNSGKSKYSGESGREQSESDYHYQQRINVYHLLRPVNEGSTKLVESVAKLIDTQVVDVRQSGWLSFDILPAMDSWIRHPEQNNGLLVRVTDVSGRHRARHTNLVVVNHADGIVTTTDTVQSSGPMSTSDQSRSTVWHEVQPSVFTFSSKQAPHLDPKRSRVKREHTTAESQPTQHHKKRKNSRGSKTRGGKHAKNGAAAKMARKGARDRCGRQPLYFDFHVVGWMDWIVAPPGFQAYFCQGECFYPMTANMNFTNHATIQALVHSVNHEVVPPPCCVPTDMSPITLLYHDMNGKVVLTNYHDMVVEGCGCR